MEGKNINEWVSDNMSNIKINGNFMRWFYAYQLKLVYNISHDF